MNHKSIIKFSLYLSFLVIGVLLSSCGGNSPGPSSTHWTQQANFPSGFFSLSDPTFVIGTKAYVMNVNHTFWEYDQTTNKWTQKKNFSVASDKDYAFAFSLGQKGYIGCGGEAVNTTDFWIYDPASDTWTKKTDFPGGKRYAARALIINGKAYVMSGEQSSTGYMQDVWEYDATGDQWAKKANMPALGRRDGIAFAIGDKGYFGSGYNGYQTDPILNDFWEYTPATDSWVKKKDFSGVARYTQVSFSVGTMGYMGTGFESAQPNAMQDFWQYNPATDTWTQLENIGKSIRYNAVSFVIGNTAYVGSGNDAADYDIITVNGYPAYSYYLYSYTPH